MAVIVLVVITVLFTGCTSPTDQKIPAATGSPVVTAGQGAPVPASTQVSASLPYGVTISVPAGWTRQDVLTSGVRDYGTTTLNIANFYSPNAITGDPASYTSLSVDIDQNPGADFEKYFNTATLAVTKTYGNPTTVEAHSYTIPISGYKSYRAGFPDRRGKRDLHLYLNGKWHVYLRVQGSEQTPGSPGVPGSDRGYLHIDQDQSPDRCRHPAPLTNPLFLPRERFLPTHPFTCGYSPA